MDVFKYLEDDNASIVQHLSDTAKNYSEWSRERVFEEAKKAFASAHKHLAIESILENNLKDPAPVQSVLSELSKLKNEITAELEQIVELHIDEPGFEQSIETIADKFNQYAQFSKQKFYPAMQKIISADDLKRISDQMEQKVLS